MPYFYFIKENIKRRTAKKLNKMRCWSGQSSVERFVCRSAACPSATSFCYIADETRKGPCGARAASKVQRVAQHLQTNCFKQFIHKYIDLRWPHLISLGDLNSLNSLKMSGEVWKLDLQHVQDWLAGRTSTPPMYKAQNEATTIKTN